MSRYLIQCEEHETLTEVHAASQYQAINFFHAAFGETVKAIASEAGFHAGMTLFGALNPQVTGGEWPSDGLRDDWDGVPV